MNKLKAALLGYTFASTAAPEYPISITTATGTCWTRSARSKCAGIAGLVPDVTQTEDLQLSRVMMQLGHKNTDLDRYIYLVNLLDHNETLFYRTVMSDPARFLPIVYDPTIGEALFLRRRVRRGRAGGVPEVLHSLRGLASVSVTSTGKRAACICR